MVTDPNEPPSQTDYFEQLLDRWRGMPPRARGGLLVLLFAISVGLIYLGRFDVGGFLGALLGVVGIWWSTITTLEGHQKFIENAELEQSIKAALVLEADNRFHLAELRWASYSVLKEYYDVVRRIEAGVFTELDNVNDSIAFGAMTTRDGLKSLFVRVDARTLRDLALQLPTNVASTVIRGFSGIGYAQRMLEETIGLQDKSVNITISMARTLISELHALDEAYEIAHASISTAIPKAKMPNAQNVAPNLERLFGYAFGTESNLRPEDVYIIERI